MSKYTWPVTVVVAAVVLVIGAVVVALILHGSPRSGANRTSAAAPSPAASSPFASAATEQAAPLEDVKLCTSPVVTCTGEMRTEPAQIGLAADGTVYLTSLVWSGWGTATATATATLEVNNCEPNCAQGTFTGYPATVKATGLTHYGNGLQAYANLAISAPSAPSSIRSSRYTSLLPSP